MLSGETWATKKGGLTFERVTVFPTHSVLAIAIFTVKKKTTLLSTDTPVNPFSQILSQVVQ